MIAIETISNTIVSITTIKEGVWGFFLSKMTFPTSPKTTSHTRYFFENLELLKFMSDISVVCNKIFNYGCKV